MRSLFAMRLAFVSVLIFFRPMTEVKAQNIPPGVLATRAEALQKAVAEYAKALEQIVKLEADYHAEEENANRLKQGRAAGDPVYDGAETKRKRAQSDLDAAKNEQGTRKSDLENRQRELNDAVFYTEQVLKAAMPIQPGLAAFEQADRESEAALKRFNVAKADLEEAHREVERQNKRKADTDPNDKLAVAIATVAQTNASAKESEAKTRLTTADNALADAVKARARNLYLLRKIIDALKSGLAQLGIKLSRVYPAKDSSGVQRAEFLAHGARRHSTAPIPSDPSFSSPNATETSPAFELYPETFSGIVGGEIVGERNGSNGSPAVPFVQALEPPIAPTPFRSEHCEPREIPLDDPACSWKLNQRKLVIELLPRPEEQSPETDGDSTTDGVAIAPEKTPKIETATGAIAAPKMATRAFVFDSSAYFPVMRFKSRFKSYEDEGVRIVEGMAFRLAADGSYEVEFLVEGLSTPVTVRLQFTVGIGDRLRTLTLPPLTLDPRTLKRSDELPNTWSIINRGASSFVRNAFVRPGTNVTLSRDGVARFGAGIEPIFSNAR